MSTTPTQEEDGKEGGDPDSVKGKGQRSLPALFVRSGTSTGLVLKASDLPPLSSMDKWRDILPAAMGSPDPIYRRQLDGMGGGISSTSKVCVLAPSSSSSRGKEGRGGEGHEKEREEEEAEADVHFTFVQVGIRDGELDLAGNCGNMSAVVGPVAWDWGFVPETERQGRVRVVEKKGEGAKEGAKEGRERGERVMEAMVKVFNTNTNKIIHSRFRVSGNPPRYDPSGDYGMDGVPGTQSRITVCAYLLIYTSIYLIITRVLNPPFFPLLLAFPFALVSFGVLDSYTFLRWWCFSYSPPGINYILTTLPITNSSASSTQPVQKQVVPYLQGIQSTR